MRSGNFKDLFFNPTNGAVGNLSPPPLAKLCTSLFIGRNDESGFSTLFNKHQSCLPIDYDVFQVETLYKGLT